jgi:hypothetical protein
MFFQKFSGDGAGVRGDVFRRALRDDAAARGAALRASIIFDNGVELSR